MSESNDKETTENNSKYSYSHQLYLMIGQTNRRKINFQSASSGSVYSESYVEYQKQKKTNRVPIYRL